LGFFGGHFVGESSRSGVSFPDMVKIASAYGIKALRIESHADMLDVINTVLQDSGPVLCDVSITQEQLFAPRTSSLKLPDGRMVSKPLEDLYPFLSRQELEENMIIPIRDS
jgi:acetolactate synthase-1/2/3 large subunit